MGEYPLNCYAGVNLRYDNDEMLYLAEQENWEEVMEALEIKLAPVNKSRNIENPNKKKKKGEEESFNCQSLKYLGELYSMCSMDFTISYTQPWVYCQY